MNSTLALIINVPILFLLYVLTYFTQALSGKRQFYGISLNYDYFNKKEFKVLDKKYKLFTTIGFIISLILELSSIYIFKAYVASSILPMLVFCLYNFFVYINIHNKVKELKSKLSFNISDLDLEKNNVMLDTEFIQEKNIIVKRYSLLHLIPLIVVTIVGVYVLASYNSIPDVIPTHWGPSGNADAFADKSFIKILAIVGMMIGLGVVIYISSISSLKTRAKLSINSIDNSKKAHLHYLNMFGFTFLVLNIGCEVLFIDILIATMNASSVNPLILWPTTIIIILTANYQTYLYYKSPNKSKSASYSIDDDDSLWIFGCIYNNSNDPSIFVN
ncbi:DUF1648 domain-containing protein [Romboutsia ilealis]|nr:DUF1648 domain-containing protein [Romboutsia ilealis]